MSLIKFEILNSVVELGSLTKAAEHLGLTQSAVSHAISSMESEWGFTLLKRDRSGISLTSNGERLLKTIRNILMYNEQLKQEIALINHLEVGTIKIGTFSSVSSHWLPAIMKQFQLNFPSIEIKLLEGVEYNELEQRLLDGSVDISFLALPSTYPFETIALTKDKICCVLPMNHPLSNKEIISIEDIKDEPFIMPKWGTDNDVNRILKAYRTKLNVKYEVVEDQTIMAMVRNGLGVSILPKMAFANFVNGVKVIDLEGDHYRTIGLATPSLKKLSPATLKFIETLKLFLKERNIRYNQ